jgi:hypothetical protein
VVALCINSSAIDASSGIPTNKGCSETLWINKQQLLVVMGVSKAPFGRRGSKPDE